MDRSNDIYQKVTDQIIAELENGNVPWIRPWRDGEPPFPINALSGRQTFDFERERLMFYAWW